ncbi:HlyD family efflux transporter periplasmic adaptor subunit [Silanimonas sp.]|uniref:HlyD family secretion protein n=1 Tax=Silanimonas sp. TaxID=1929290 RepID=UPI001BC20A0B|nr:HlyD family efflux transporter periplasmic adaptor subunit [Silanimonas sp.]MBS3896350.1 HlyD family efflux transporter periplasmic adaptor subunit [Silanimonas sp.]
MTDTLFRKEVLEARQTRWLGGIVLGQPLSLWLLTGFAVFAAAIIVLFLVLGEYTRRTRVSGQLQPSQGVAMVVAPAPGTLTELRVEEGQRVLAGEVLAVLAMPRATLAGGDTAQAVQAAIAERQEGVAGGFASQREQLKAQEAGLELQMASTQAELRQIEAELGTRRAQHRLAQQTTQRLQELRARQFITELQWKQQQAAELEQLGQVQALERQLFVLHRQRTQLQQAQRELPSRLAALEAAEQRERASLDQEAVETGARAEAVIRAPLAGIVATRLGQPGQAVQAGQPLLSLLPAASQLEAHLLVPSRAIGFVAPGDAVLLRYQAFPFQRFGQHPGRVQRISRSALGPSEQMSLLGTTQLGEPHYRIVVALEKQTVRAFGQDEALKPGMLLDAHILGERRTLWEWVLEPLYALSGSLAGTDQNR